MHQIGFIKIGSLKRDFHPSGLQTPSALAFKRYAATATVRSRVNSDRKRWLIKTIDQFKRICGTTVRASVQPVDRGSRDYSLIKRIHQYQTHLWDNILLHSRILKALQITFHVERVYTRKALSVTICILKLMKTRAF